MLPTLYALGSNGSGQLGLGHCKDVDKPTPCNFKIKLAPGRIPTSIAAGGNHTLILCNDDSVYSAGDNSDGRCGIISRTTTATKSTNGGEKSDSPLLCTSFRRVAIPGPSSDDPEDIPSPLTNFKFVSATWSASFFATPSAIYSAGTGLKGELGLGSDVSCTNEKSPHPIQIPDFPPEDTTIVYLASGVHHTLAILSTGDVYGWGVARHGELGEPRVPFVTEPRKIGEVGFRACKAVAGLDWTYVFSAAVDGAANGDGGFQHVVFGGNKHDLRTLMPAAHTLSTYESVTASWSSIFVLLRSGAVVSWGRSSEEKDASAPPPTIPRTEMLFAGSEHVIARGTEDGHVRAWGWGEHGNCGEGWGCAKYTAESVQTGDEAEPKKEVEMLQSKAPWNELRVPELDTNAAGKKHYVPIGAGCATTWLLLEEDSE